jgi:hypothetical protein
MFTDGRIIADIPVRNRLAAIEALGTLGVATEEVLKLLRANWTNDVPRIREVTAYSVGKLASQSLSLLDFFIAHLDRKNERVLQHQLDALAKMGTNARVAVPALLDLSFSLQSSFLTFTTKIPRSAPIGYRRTLLWSNETEPGMMAAAFALAEIDPEAATRRLELIAAGLRGLAPSNAVVRLRPYSRELIRIAEPGLREGREIERILLAHHILLLDPYHAAARTLLETQMTAENLSRRAVAASWLYHATHETGKTLAVLSDCVARIKTRDDQVPLTILREFGRDAKPLATQIRPLLDHPDQIIRSLAGKALRAIAPELMPPIREDAKW